MDSHADRGLPSRPSPHHLQTPDAHPRNRQKTEGGGAAVGERSTLCERGALASLIALGRDRIFREDLLDPLESLLGGGLGCHAALHDIGPPDAPDMLVADL